MPSIDLPARSLARSLPAQVRDLSKRIAEDATFNNFVTVVIVIAGVQVGMGTYKPLSYNCHNRRNWTTRLGGEVGCLNTLGDAVIKYIFTTECAVKLVAEAPKAMRYFRSGWNTFDFFIVSGSYVNADGLGSMLMLLRLLRLLRVLKLIKRFPQLQVIVNALAIGLSSIGYIAMILGFFFYLFAIVGQMFFRTNDPTHFGSLHVSMLTLYRCATLEDWTDVMYINMYGCHKWGYDEHPEEVRYYNTMHSITLHYITLLDEHPEEVCVITIQCIP